MSEKAKEEVKDVHVHLSKRALTWAIIGVLATILFGIIDITFKLGIFKSIIDSNPQHDTSISVTPKRIAVILDTIPSQKIITASQSKIAPTEEFKPVTKESKPDVPKKDITVPITSVEKSNTEDAASNYINKSTTKNDIAVVVLDNTDRPVNSISSDIANLYRSKGHTVTTSLFTNGFFRSKYLEGIQDGNTKMIEKLGLVSEVNYVVIAKYANMNVPGNETKWISRANLEVSVISCISKSQQDAFMISVSNGFDDEQHAEMGAKEKIIQAFRAAHLNL